MAVVNVFNTASTAENLSRHDLIQWVNGTLRCNYVKIEDLCSGNMRITPSNCTYSPFLYGCDLLSLCIHYGLHITHKRLSFMYKHNYKSTLVFYIDPDGL